MQRVPYMQQVVSLRLRSSMQSLVSAPRFAAQGRLCTSREGSRNFTNLLIFARRLHSVQIRVWTRYSTHPGATRGAPEHRIRLCTRLGASFRADSWRIRTRSSINGMCGTPRLPQRGICNTEHDQPR